MILFKGHLWHLELALIAIPWVVSIPVFRQAHVNRWQRQAISCRLKLFYCTMASYRILWQSSRIAAEEVLKPLGMNFHHAIHGVTEIPCPELAPLLIFGFLGVPLFSTNLAKNISIFAGLLIPA